MRYGTCSVLASETLLKMVLTRLMRWATNTAASALQDVASHHTRPSRLWEYCFEGRRHSRRGDVHRRYPFSFVE